MGASYNQVTLKGDRASVKKQFEKLQENDRHENGHSYSGGFGMATGLEFAGYIATNESEAAIWLDAHCEKRETAKAIQVNGKPNEWIIGAWCSC
jgi:hypothetical protein